MSKIIIFDVCWTLYSSNTTFDYIRYVLRQKSKLRYLCSKILDLNLVKLPLVLLGRIISKDIYRAIYIYLLKGFDKDTLYKLSYDFYDIFLEKHRIDHSHLLLERFQKEDIILCSASLNVIIDVVKERLNLSACFSSELAFKGNKCLGFLKQDLFLTKKNLFPDKPYWVITDNKTDLDLVKHAENYSVISNRKNLGFWNKNNIKVDYIME